MTDAELDAMIREECDVANWWQPDTAEKMREVARVLTEQHRLFPSDAALVIGQIYTASLKEERGI